MNTKILITLILFLLIISLGLGMLTQQSNPNGIQLFTPPADGIGSESKTNAFAFGFVFGSTTLSIFYFLSLPVIALYGYLRKRTIKHTLLQVAGAVIFGIAITIVVNYKGII